MNKLYLKFIGVFVIALFMFGFSKNVKASVKDTMFRDVVVALGEDCPTCTGGPECDSIFGDPTNCGCPAYWIQWVLTVMKYVAIGALLIFTTLDFIKALVANDKDALQKAITTVSKRFIFCVIIFFLPIIIDFFMSLIGAYGTCGIS